MTPREVKDPAAAQTIIDHTREMLAKTEALNAKIDAEIPESVVFTHRTKEIPATLVDFVRELRDKEFVPINTTPWFPSKAATDDGHVVHGAMLGKGKDRRLWVSEALWRAVQG